MVNYSNYPYVAILRSGSNRQSVATNGVPGMRRLQNSRKWLEIIAHFVPRLLTRRAFVEVLLHLFHRYTMPWKQFIKQEPRTPEPLVQHSTTVHRLEQVLWLCGRIFSCDMYRLTLLLISQCIQNVSQHQLIVPKIAVEVVLQQRSFR